MSVRYSNRYRAILAVLTLVCLGGAGYLAYTTFFATGSAAKQLKAATDAYDRGLQAYEAKNWGEAAARFDEANLQASNANKTLDEQTKEGKLPAEEAQELQGRIMWVKARAIRDQAYAQGQVDSKPLPDVTDPQYGETYRTFTAIPNGEAQKEALNALRVAVARLGADPEVNKEALRFELILPQIQWSVAEPLLRKALSVNKKEKDARANYYLARFEYEQPADERGTPSALNQRSPDRMEKALELLAAAKRSEPAAPYWRTVGMEADVLDWPLRTAASRKLKPDAVAAAEKAIDQLLFEPQAGALATMGQPDKLAGIGNADALGLVSVLTTAYERAATDANKPGGNTDRLKLVARAALDLANKMADSEPLKPYLAQVAPALLQIASGAQGQLARMNPTEWREYVAGIDAVLAKSPDPVKSSPKVRMALARIATADAANPAEAARAKELLARAVKELEEGLKAATEAKSPPAVTDEFHVELADRLLQTGAKAEQLEPHLAPLRVSSLPRAKLLGQLFDAVLAERQGRLDKARKLLLTVAADRANPDVAFQANVLVANVSAASGDWPAALAALKDVESRYKAAALPASARAWADERLGGADGVAAALVEANLNVAAQVTMRYRRENPNKPVPADLTAAYVNSAEALVKTLRAPTGSDRVARLTLARYYLLTNRRKEADARFDTLSVDYPDSMDVLRVRCQALAAPTEAGAANPAGVTAADDLIEKFLKNYPALKAAKLFKAEWLIRTGRADKAVEYLENPMIFAAGDPAVDRLLAAALLRKGEGAEAQKVLSRLPSDPLVDAILLQGQINKEAGAAKLKEAMGRYENQGMFRIYEAALRLGEGKYEESVRGFLSAAEFTQYGNAAKAGMRRALFAFAEAQPAKARELAVRLAAEMPDEPGVYLGAALAALLMDDVGTPEDKWDNTKTMYAAVNRWEAAALKAGVAPADVVVAKAQFRLLAGDVVGARQEALTGHTRNPKHVPLLLMLAELSLAPPADPARARDFLALATKENGNDPRLPLIEAMIRSVTGEATGDLAKAGALYEKLIVDSPRNGTLYALLITVREMEKKGDDALRWAREWAARVPEDNRASTELIRLLTMGGKKDEAVKVADDLVAKRVEEARKRATAATPALAPAEVDKIVNEARGTALLAASTGFFRATAFPEADVRAREVLKAFPDAARVSLLVGDIAISRQDWDAAVLVYADLLKKHPRHFIAGNNLAWILAEKKDDPVKALEIVTEIRKARDGDRPIGPERLPADFLDTIGVVYTKLKAKPNQPDRTAEMKATFEAAAARYPIDPRMHLYLGYALDAGGQRSEALRVFNETKRLAGVKNNLRDDQNKAVAASAEAALSKLQK